jgi:hypothetical protein
MPPWLLLGFLPDLPVSSLAKTTSAAPFLLICVAALTQPGPSRSLPRVALLYPATAVLWIACVAMTADSSLAVLIRLEWLLLIFAALFVATRMANATAVVAAFRALAIGHSVCALVLAAAVILDPGAIHRGFGRFEPWGSNPNAIGLFLAGATFLAFGQMLVSRRRVWAFVGAMSFSLTLITGSRGSVLVMGIALAPLVARVSRRPLAAMAIFALGSFLLVGLVDRSSGSIKLARVAELQSRRGVIAESYTKSILERPVSGVLLTRGRAATLDPSIIRPDGSRAQHAHNGYLEVGYVGGLLLLVPTLLLVAMSVKSAFVVWRRPVEASQTIVAPLFAILVAVYVQGLTSPALFYPTYAWAFIHVLVAVLFIQARMPAPVVKRPTIEVVQPPAPARG